MEPQTAEKNTIKPRATVRRLAYEYPLDASTLRGTQCVQADLILQTIADTWPSLADVYTDLTQSGSESRAGWMLARTGVALTRV